MDNQSTQEHVKAVLQRIKQQLNISSAEEIAARLRKGGYEIKGQTINKYIRGATEHIPGDFVRALEKTFPETVVSGDYTDPFLRDLLDGKKPHLVMAKQVFDENELRSKKQADHDRAREMKSEEKALKQANQIERLLNRIEKLSDEKNELIKALLSNKKRSTNRGVHE